MKYFSRSVLILFFLGCALIVSQASAQSLDSLHVRDADSTKIIIDTKTVPAAIRSRGHQLTTRFPLGFMPREESGAAGFWQTEIRPQYANDIYLGNVRVTTRLRPEIPLRYLPQHSQTGIQVYPNDSTGYPLRSYSLQRREEPMVNLVYKEGDYGLSALSIGLAADITEDTHLHLGRESSSYVGQYGIDGLESLNYLIGVHHKVSDKTHFRYNTFYSKDRNNWTYAMPTPGRLGSESTSWYQHFLRWNSLYDSGEWDYGIRLGSQRLWLNQSAGRIRLTELQRGGWLNYRRELTNSLSLSAGYNALEHQMEGTGETSESEQWHRVKVGAHYESGLIQIDVAPQLLGLIRDETDTYLVGKASTDIRAFTWLTISGKYRSDVFAAPYQWLYSSNRVTSQNGMDRLTRFRKTSLEAQLEPIEGLSLSGGMNLNNYTDWHRLTYTMNAARTDSMLTHETLSGDFTGYFAELNMRMLDWLQFGGRYDVYPSVTHELPELWSRQAATGWLEVQRYLFNNNLHLHLYAEGGIIMSRQPVGWHPVLQSLTYYSTFSNPAQSSFVHLAIIGDVGPFTISTSFYNLLGSNLTYAIDQRPRASIFYLGVRWQLWN